MEETPGSHPPGGDDFPPGDDGCTRRRALNAFLASGVVATGASVAYPLGRFLLPPEQAESAASSVVAGDKTGPFRPDDFPVNTGRIFKMGSKPGILVRLPDGEFRAFSAACTHLSCLVSYRADKKVLWCACHAGAYDLTGRNIAGPPPRPLAAFTVNVKGDEIIVSRGS
ncbi:MAG: ubiquinol-cytochrome c reductase iron-sulfur subunit [Planctomycetaceae bacterium]|nr:ubiquinol-cytochrome c reductase iron-sulfur subunit [Planctomycetota bacterium]NUN51350.1 ubiquinol-cytochrome c reductase iron-sulfur subunit [Planctomycetaceae bacterium]